MRYRVSGPEEMIPFHITFYQEVGGAELVEMAKTSAREDKTPVVVAIQPDGTIFGAVNSKDSYFQNSLPQSHSPVLYGNRLGAELMTGFAMCDPANLGVGLLVMPRPPSQPPTSTSLPLVLGRWSCEFGTEEMPNWQEVTLVCGRLRQRKFRGPKFVVETARGLVAMLRMPESPDKLQEHFFALANELGVKECWAHHGNIVYHLQW